MSIFKHLEVTLGRHVEPNYMRLNLEAWDMTPRRQEAVDLRAPFFDADTMHTYQLRLAAYTDTTCSPRDWPHARPAAVRALAESFYGDVRGQLYRAMSAIQARDGRGAMEILETLFRDIGPDSLLASYEAGVANGTINPETTRA